MPAYLVANIDVHDPERYAEDYGTLATAAVARHAGRFLARGGHREPLEGDDFRERVVIIEFESMEKALAWYRSDDYQAAIPVRQRLSTGSMVIVDGVATPGPPGA